jgi:putative ABC transport system substrate-binding protein
MAVRSAVNVPVVANDLETDPVASGLISSLAHPGGNLTGVFFDFPEFAAKSLELLKETCRGSRRWSHCGIPAPGRCRSGRSRRR